MPFLLDVSRQRWVKPNDIAPGSPRGARSRHASLSQPVGLRLDGTLRLWTTGQPSTTFSPGNGHAGTVTPPVKEHPDVSFIPVRGESTAPAYAVCSGCLVRDECAAAGIDGNEFGVWVSMSGRDRRELRAIAA